MTYTEAQVLEAAYTFGSEDFERLPGSVQCQVLGILLTESAYLLEREVLTTEGWRALQEYGMLMQEVA